MADDPVEPGRPGAPRLVSALRGPSGVTVTWLAPDNGGAALTAYKIYRGAAAGQETLLARIAPDKPRFIDTSADSHTVYFYKVAAVNSAGTSATCGEVAVTAAPPAQTSCALPGITLAGDATGDQLGAP